MNTVVAIGESHELQGFALVGATVVIAATGADAVDAWQQLDGDVQLLILSPMAARHIEPLLGQRPSVLTAVMP